MKLSQSVLSSAGDCLLKAQYTLDRPTWVKRVGSAARAVGTGYHGGLELLYTARMNGLPEPTLDDIIGEGIRVFDLSTAVDLYDDTPLDEFLWDEEKVPNAAKAHDNIAQMLSVYVNGGHVWPEDWRVLAVELHGSIPDQVIGAEAKVGADLLLQDPNGWIVADDHKTGGKAWASGKESPRKNTQSPYYNRLIKQLYPGAPGYRFVFSIMTYPTPRSGPKFERRISDPSPAHEDAVAKRASDFVAMYQEVHVRLGRDLPGNPASTLCNPKWCDYWDGCPYGAALDN